MVRVFLCCNSLVVMSCRDFDLLIAHSRKPKISDLQDLVNASFSVCKYCAALDRNSSFTSRSSIYINVLFSRFKARAHYVWPACWCVLTKAILMNKQFLGYRDIRKHICKVIR